MSLQLDIICDNTSAWCFIHKRKLHIPAVLLLLLLCGGGGGGGGGDDEVVFVVVLVLTLDVVVSVTSTKRASLVKNVSGI